MIKSGYSGIFLIKKETIYNEVTNMNDEDVKIYIPKANQTDIPYDNTSEVKIYPSVSAEHSEHLP